MTLAVFTNHYPYGRGEEFFEDELKIIAPAFDEIVIFCSEKGKIGNTRPLPENARVVMCRPASKAARALSALRAAALLPFSLGEIKFGVKSLGFSAKEVIKKLFLYRFTEGALAKAIKKNNLPHGTLYYSYWLGNAAAFLARKLPGRCISRAHGGDCFIARGYQPYRREILENMRAVYSISLAGKCDIDTKLLPLSKAAQSPVEVARLGITKPDARQNPKSEGGAFLVVSCSNVIALKRLDLIIGALALLGDTPVQWVHFGGGELLEKTKALAEGVLSGNKNISVKFMGQTKKADILRFYGDTHIDLFVNASDVEGIPVSVMEAMSYGIPAVARNVGGNGEIVNAENGVLLDAVCTEKQLADAVLSVLTKSDDEKEAMRAGAYRTYLENYCAEKNYTAFCADILSKSGDICAE